MSSRHSGGQHSFDPASQPARPPIPPAVDPTSPAHCHCGDGMCVCQVPEERLRGYAKAIVGIHHPAGTVGGYHQCACGAPFCGYLAHARHYLDPVG